MTELWPNVLVSSCLSAMVAALLRELFADRHIHWAARVLGLSSWVVLATYCWCLVHTIGHGTPGDTRAQTAQSATLPYSSHVTAFMSRHEAD